MIHIAYYISGHGYGHAVRSIEVIKALLAQNPYLFFHIRTTAPPWFFSLNLKNSFVYEHCEIDVGTMQHDFSEVDIPATYERVSALFAQKTEIVAREVRLLKEKQIELVVGDIPSLAFAAAEAARLPSVAIGNFSWDWIYEKFIEMERGFRELITQIRVSYRKADVLLRLPMYGEMDAFRHIIDVPLVARKAQRRVKDVRHTLRLPEGARMVLVAMRLADLHRVQLDNVTADKRNRIVVINQNSPIAGVQNLPEGLLPFQELVNAADVVVSKPGYGIVSECLINQTPLIFTERKDFCEYPILVEAIEKYGIGQFIELNQFFAGRWQSAIENALKREISADQVMNHGAAVAANHIISVLVKGSVASDAREPTLMSD